MNEELKPYQNLSLQDIEGEEWDHIPIVADWYMISNKGRVKSSFKKKEKILKHYFNGAQTIIRLRITKTKARTLHVPIMVAEVFLKNPNNYKYVFHKDLNNLQDNSIENLYWNNTDGFSLEEGDTNSGYKGVTSKVLKNGSTIFTLHVGINGKRIYKEFKDVIEAAHKYDYYIKKHNLKRKGNFPES